VEYPALDVFKYSSLVVSTITGIMILSQKENRVAYPQRFLGLICLAQSCYFWYEQVKYVNLCTEYTPFKTLLKNSMILKGSRVSEMLGFHLGDLNEIQIAGILETTQVFVLIGTIGFEAIWSMAINLDVALTLRNSFNRS
jgi:hypothetical protein